MTKGLPDPVSLTERINRVCSLDLGPIKFKLVHGEHERVSRETVEESERLYKRFLILQLKYPEAKIVPNTQIDTFWHAHILDTQKYAADCEYVLGYFLHHFPYFGLRGEEDARALESSFQETLRLYYAEFGEHIQLTSESCQVASCDAEQCNPAECHQISAIRPTLTAVAA